MLPAVLARKRFNARRAATEAAVVLALAGTTWLLYRDVLRLWWTYDDFFHLRGLLTKRPFWYFFAAAGEPESPAQLLTPLLFFSLDLDRRAFGLHPAAFYLHHHLALSLCTAALYGALRLWLPRLWAAAGAAIFLLGPVTASLAASLFVRHYIEAVLLAALAVRAWGSALRRFPGPRAWALAWLSAALYFAACLAKEIAVPLILLLPLLPASGKEHPGFAERCRLALPHAAVVVLYLVLRYALLGTVLGGYGFAVGFSDLPVLALKLPGKIAADFVAGPTSVAAVIFVLALAAGVSLLLFPSGGRRAAGLTCLALLLALLPVLPVSTQMEPRYAVATWMVVAVAFASGCGTLAAAASRMRRWLAFVVAAVACISGLWLNRQDWPVRFARAERMSVENRFLLEMREGNTLRQPLTSAASLQELEWMKATVYRRPAGGLWFQDDLYLCLHRGELGRVWGYDPGSRRVVDLTAQIPALRARHCASIRVTAPLNAGFQVTRGNLFWDLGPYREGEYRFVLGDGRQAFEMPREAGFQVRGRPALPPLRIGYESPAGWITYSPEAPAPPRRRLEASLGATPQAVSRRRSNSLPSPSTT